jgi:hypothetical protein
LILTLILALVVVMIRWLIVLLRLLVLLLGWLSVLLVVLVLIMLVAVVAVLETPPQGWGDGWCPIRLRADVSREASIFTSVA